MFSLLYRLVQSSVIRTEYTTTQYNYSCTASTLNDNNNLAAPLHAAADTFIKKQTVETKERVFFNNKIFHN